MEIRVCTKCGVEKDAAEYYTRAAYRGAPPGKTLEWCKQCMRNKTSEYRRMATARLREYKETLSCVDCGMSFKGLPTLCDFHHRDPTIKKNQVSDFRTRSEKAVMEEIAKCDALCANCHRKRHWYEQNPHLLLPV